MAMFGLEAILCADVLVENGVWVEVCVRAWVGPRVGIGFLFVLRVGVKVVVCVGVCVGVKGF